MPTRIGCPPKNRVQGERLDSLDRGGIERLQDRLGLGRLVGDPAADGRVVGGLTGRQQGLEPILDRTRADPGGEGDGGHLSQLGRVAEDRPVGSSAQGGELIAKPRILGEEFGVVGLWARRVEP